eukprot:CAMPEP_0170268156 /NCGR_PEP_ID=MMETSP0116_2-20130129/34006_1 /TAXON_ID=400756 /ORGANISM="Durinskia baltica, Strain CSIRO CS-38" /LENGTH=156 /DNA_ID=CAMNT_0010519315 /DNA_START=35 /DNA_END=505 /DNA_ORIENTATION=+
MTQVQADMAWRRRMIDEVVPLDRPVTSISQVSVKVRNPVSWKYGDDAKGYFDGASMYSASSRATRSSYSSSSFSRRSGARSSSYSGRSSQRLSTAGVSSMTCSSITRSCSSSAISSRSGRSSALSMELNHERQLREATEREIADLKAKLKQQGEVR